MAAAAAPSAAARLASAASRAARGRALGGGRAPRAAARRGRGVRCTALFNRFRQNSEDAGVYESQGRDDIDEDDVEMYFNYMGMLANEGSYDRMQKFFEAGIHPCDIILLMACEEGDTPKIEELIKAGADTSVKDWQGKTCMELAANDKVKALL